MKSLGKPRLSWGLLPTALVTADSVDRYHASPRPSFRYWGKAELWLTEPQSKVRWWEWKVPGSRSDGENGKPLGSRSDCENGKPPAQVEVYHRISILITAPVRTAMPGAVGGGPMNSSLNFWPLEHPKRPCAGGGVKTLPWNGNPSTEWHLMISIS